MVGIVAEVPMITTSSAYRRAFRWESGRRGGGRCLWKVLRAVSASRRTEGRELIYSEYKNGERTEP